MANKIFQFLLKRKKMHNIAFPVNSIDSIAENIDGEQIGLAFSQLGAPYEPFIGEDNQHWLLKMVESPQENPSIVMEYQNTSNPFPMTSNSIDFIGRRPPHIPH